MSSSAAAASSPLRDFHRVVLVSGRRPWDFCLRVVSAATAAAASKIRRGLEEVAADPDKWKIPQHIVRPLEVENTDEDESPCHSHLSLFQRGSRLAARWDDGRFYRCSVVEALGDDDYFVYQVILKLVFKLPQSTFIQFRSTRAGRSFWMRNPCSCFLRRCAVWTAWPSTAPSRGGTGRPPLMKRGEPAPCLIDASTPQYFSYSRRFEAMFHSAGEVYAKFRPLPPAAATKYAVEVKVLKIIMSI